MRHRLVIADRVAILPFIVNKLITNQGVTPFRIFSHFAVIILPYLASKERFEIQQSPFAPDISVRDEEGFPS